MLRLSNKEALIVEQLIDGSERYGLQMVEDSKGGIKLGTIYVTLQRLQEKGYVTSRPEPRSEGEPGVARRLYRVTDLGEKMYAAHQMAAIALQEAFG
jgi:PadR family transcriptional regulator, regulatory protein PadR